MVREGGMRGEGGAKASEIDQRDRQFWFPISAVIQMSALSSASYDEPPEPEIRIDEH